MPRLLRVILATLSLAAAAGVRATPAPHPLEGIWTGTVTAPQGEAEIGFRFQRDAAGKLVLTMHMPVMHLYDQVVGPYVEEHEGGYRIPFLDTAWRLQGDTLTGTFALGRLPMRLTRGGAFSPRPPASAPPPAAPAAHWSYPLGAPSWASPVVQDGIVYVGASDGRFHAVRAQDGTGLWTWSGPHRIDGQAAVHEAAVYFVDGAVALVCLDRTSGALRWREPLHDAAIAGGPPKPNPTFNRRTATPLVRDGVVYAGSTDGGLYAIDARTGARRWRFAAGAPIHSGLAADGDQLTFGTMDGTLVTVDRDGHEIARAKAGGAIVTTPLLVAGRAIVGARDYQLYAFDRGTGTVAWRYSYWFSWIESPPQLRDGVVYVGGSDFRRVTALDPADGRALWSTDVRGLAWGAPALTEKRVFIGTVAQRPALLAHEAGLVALDRRTGAVLWRRPAEPPPAGAPMWGYAGSLAVDGERVIAAGLDGQLIALPAPD